MSSIQCQNVVKRFGKTTALAGVTATLESGKIYGLIGRNGAGKTTLMKAIAGQIIPQEGSITLDGEPILENQPMLDEICLSRGFSSQTLMAMKVKDILKSGALYYKYWDADFAKRLLEEFELPEKKQYLKLSSGMQSALNIILGFASRAPFTLFDEPVAGLDVVVRERFYQILLDDYAEHPRTFVLSTHLIEEASTIFEDIIFIDKGRVLLSEETDALRNRYRIVDGPADEVERFLAGHEVLHKEALAGKLTACVKLDGKVPPEGIEVREAPMQKLFVYLTEKNKGVGSHDAK